MKLKKTVLAVHHVIWELQNGYFDWNTPVEARIGESE